MDLLKYQHEDTATVVGTILLSTVGNWVYMFLELLLKNSDNT